MGLLTGQQWGKPILSPVVLGQVTERFRESVKAMAERGQIPIHAFNHKERKDDVANQIRRPTTRYTRRSCVHRRGAGESTHLPR